MRDVKRIDTVMSRMGELWKKSCPDLRFGQLMHDFAYWHEQVHKTGMFFVEDEVLLARFEEFLISMCGRPCRKT